MAPCATSSNPTAVSRCSWCCKQALEKRGSRSGNLPRVEKGRRWRPFPPKHVSPAPWARPGKRTRKPCYARLPNPPHRSLDSECPSEGTEGSVSLVGCCHRRWQSDPKESIETSGGRGQRPPRRLRLRVCGPPNLPEDFIDNLRGAALPLPRCIRLDYSAGMYFSMIAGMVPSAVSSSRAALNFSTSSVLSLAKQAA